MKTIYFYFLLFASFLPMLSSAQDEKNPPCSELLQPKVILRGQQVDGPLFSLIVKGQGSKWVTVDQLGLHGIITEVRLVGAKFNPLFQGRNIAYEMKRHVDHNLELWKQGVFNGNDALHYASLEDLVKIRAAGQDEHQVQEVFQRAFLAENKITDLSSGVFVNPRDRISKDFGTMVVLTPDGKLKKIDLGDLPGGIYKLEFSLVDAGKRHLRDFFLFIRD